MKEDGEERWTPVVMRRKKKTRSNKVVIVVKVCPMEGERMFEEYGRKTVTSSVVVW